MEIPKEIILLIIDHLPYGDRMKLARCRKEIWRIVESKMNLPITHFNYGWFLRVREAKSDIFYEIAAYYRCRRQIKDYYFYRKEEAISWHLSKFAQSDDIMFLSRHNITNWRIYLFIRGKYTFAGGRFYDAIMREDRFIAKSAILFDSDICRGDIAEHILVMLFAKNTTNAINIFNKIHLLIHHGTKNIIFKKTIRLNLFLRFIGIYVFARKYSPLILNISVLSHILNIFSINRAFLDRELNNIIAANFLDIVLSADDVKKGTRDILYAAAL